MKNTLRERFEEKIRDEYIPLTRSELDFVWSLIEQIDKEAEKRWVQKWAEEMRNRILIDIQERIQSWNTSIDEDYLDFIYHLSL